ncbi:MAG: N-acetyl-gamma-glutamyl-phosphate reductase [Eudoraea sp.]|nr:N-acetyl-gamma-glutamyl-phosphate reductase [Eudoraea sp.]
MKRIGIIGGSGYTAGELIRLLINHPQAGLDFVYSRTNPGKLVSSVHTDLTGQTELEFTDKVEKEVDVLFLCLGHGKSREFLEQHTVSDKTLLIDLSRDFRLKNEPGIQGRTFVYGLPEMNKEDIGNSTSIANPGCFATAIQLALLPLATAGKLLDDVHVHAITGSTGAGVMPSSTTHFSWCNNNVSWYKPFVHQHETEIIQSLEQCGASPKLRFLPIRGDFPRGIYATSYSSFSGTLEEARQLYEEFYSTSSFTKLTAEPIHLKQVVNTNYCHVHLHKHEDQLLVTSALDNLMKGASGQAIENMNLSLGFPQDMGLRIKASVY